MKPICPECKKTDFSMKVICAGVPMKTCDRCELFWGFWSFVPLYIGFDGSMVAYDDGYGLKAWWSWITGNEI